METMEAVEPVVKINMRAVRIHHAAAMVAYFVRSGGLSKWSAFIRPLCASPAFNHWFHQPAHVLVDCNFVEECLAQWPREKLEYFHAYPLVQLMRRHSSYEQYQIVSILRRHHGFFFKF